MAVPGERRDKVSGGFDPVAGRTTTTTETTTMSRPRGKLFALIAVFAALGVVTASGAFTTVSAERTASVTVAGDSSALLALQADSGSPNADGTGTAAGDTDGYVTETGGQLEIDLENVNLDAVTTAEGVFTVTNQGTQAVAITVTKTDDDDISGEVDDAAAIAFGVPVSELAAYEGSALSTGDSDLYNTDSVRIDAGRTVVLEPGESITVGLFIDTSDKDPADGLDKDATGVANDDDVLDTVTIHAEATESGESYDYERVSS